jgi:hypothetical protein
MFQDTTMRGGAARKRRGGTQGAATPEGARGRGPPPAWGSLMELLRPHRAVAPAARAPTDARGDHARPHPRILARQQKKQKTSKVVNAFTVKKNFQDFFIKKGFCFHSAKKDLRSTRQNFEYKCATWIRRTLCSKTCAGRVQILVSRNQKQHSLSGNKVCFS